MLAKRIIPCLDVDQGRVVKGTHFVNLVDAGDPVENARRYDEAGADELVFLDITASSDKRATMVDVVKRTQAVVFIPFTVGGGIRSLEDIRRILEAARHDHVEKVVRPAIEKGEVVLCDRYADSSIVYQGMVRGVGEEVTADLNRIATGGLDPHLTLVLDLDHESGVARARTRNAESDGSESRLDDEPTAFHRKVREGFLRLAEREPDRVRVVSAEGDPHEVFERIRAELPVDLA